MPTRIQYWRDRLVTPKVIITLAFGTAFITATALLFLSDHQHTGFGNGSYVVNFPLVF
jgi:hypothetical protein